MKYIVVHQIFDDSGRETQSLFFEKSQKLLDRDDVKVYEYYSKGLSKSRNFGLKHCETPYAHIMDDDVEIDALEIKRMAIWMRDSSIAVATGIHAFQTKGISSRRSDVYRHSRLSLFSVSSIDICLNVEAVKRNNLFFDENFGLGSKYPSGEELIFLAECLKDNCEVYFFPACVGVHPDITSGEDFYSRKSKILAKREMIKRVFGKYAYIYIMAFWAKKARTVWRHKCFCRFTRYMLLGDVKLGTSYD